MAMHLTLHLSDDVDKLSVSRKERKREIASIEDDMDTSAHELEEITKKSKELLQLLVEALATRKANRKSNEN